MEPGRQGQPPGSKLDAFEVFILSLVEENKDISLDEIDERLRAEHGVGAVPSTVWLFFDKRGITLKKRRRTPPNSSARTFLSGARPGSTACPPDLDPEKPRRSTGKRGRVSAERSATPPG